MTPRPNPPSSVTRFAYAWRKRFPQARAVAGFEGRSVYAAESEGGFWLIKHQGTMADFLDPEQDADMLATLISLERYTSRAARDASVAQMLQRRDDARCGR